MYLGSFNLYDMSENAQQLYVTELKFDVNKFCSDLCTSEISNSKSYRREKFC